MTHYSIPGTWTNYGLCQQSDYTFEVGGDSSHEFEEIDSLESCKSKCIQNSTNLCYYSWLKEESKCRIAYDITLICHQEGWITINTKCKTEQVKPQTSTFNSTALVASLVSIFLAIALIGFLLYLTKTNRKLGGYVPSGMSMSFLQKESAEDIEGNTKHQLSDFDNLGPQKTEFSVLNSLDIQRHVMTLTTDVGNEYCDNESNNLNR